MAVIKSGLSSDNLTIDPVSKAARVTLYGASGLYQGAKATYRAATVAGINAAAGTAMFFVISGSPSKTLRIRRVRISGPIITTLAVGNIVMEKWSTAPTGGTATVLVQVPLDSNDAAASATLCQIYTVAPTEGTLVGTIGSRRGLLKSATVVDGASLDDALWEFSTVPETTGIVLRGSAQAVSLAFGQAPATAVTLSIEVEWTEEV